MFTLDGQSPHSSSSHGRLARRLFAQGAFQLAQTLNLDVFARIILSQTIDTFRCLESRQI
jgi:hypothetical protein